MTDTNTHLRPSSMADSDKTATQSHEPSILEKPNVVESVMPSAAASVKAAEPTTAEPITVDEKNTVNENTSKRNSQASASDDDDDFEYPTKWKLTAITIALCLSVFCMALVSFLLLIASD